MTLSRASGVLVHPTSFPSRCGIGDLGDGARGVFAARAPARQRLWQVLPLGPTGYGDSPYASFSAFAGNHSLIAPEMLVEQGWLRREELDDLPTFPESVVDYGQVLPIKLALLRHAHERFEAQATPGQRAECDAFAAANSAWLDDYALFMALKHAHRDAPWTEWEPDLVARQPAALARARTALAGEIRLHTFLQWTFITQWDALRGYAGERGIRVIGDVPIFVAHDSADVWAHAELFALDGRGLPTVVAGVPPDYFSRTGQRWGNPLYRWDILTHSGYSWWIDRVRAARRTADILRLDHFRGFYAYWEVPAAAPTAARGRWVRAPGAELFRAIFGALGDVPLIAEDLGKITPPVERLRASLGLPGMKVLQFAFGTDARNAHLPHLYTHDTAVYTGTHDNDTTVGWFATRGAQERDFILRYTGGDGREIHWDLMRVALASVADTAIIPLQDVLGLGSAARMNTPGTSSGNWAWRCTDAQLTAKTSERLATLTTTYGR
jgi:4-alpha-glucanotransferase